MDRREFLAVSGALASSFLFSFSCSSTKNKKQISEFRPGQKLLNWVEIHPDNTATIYFGEAEMGQGVYTSLSSVIVEECDLDWEKIRVVSAFGDSFVYKICGPFTGGSTSVRKGLAGLQKVSAQARSVLVQAAAKKYGVPTSKLRTEKGFVYLSKENKIPYSQLVSLAQKETAPKEPKLKNPKDYKLIGKRLNMLDIPGKTYGMVEFGIDVDISGMLVAAVKQSPVFGGDLHNFEKVQRQFQKMNLGPNFFVVRIPNGLAVVSKTYFQSQKVLSQLNPQFKGGNLNVTSEKIQKLFDSKIKKPGTRVKREGDPLKQLSKVSKSLTATYEVPFLAHSCMEPLCSTAWVKEDSAEIWAPSQSTLFNKKYASQITGFKEDKIKVNVTFLGGGFGRKAEQDFVAQSLIISKQLKRPIQVVWSREEDTTQDFYRPAFRATFKGGLDQRGNLKVWLAHSAGQSIMSRWFPKSVKKGIDHTSVEGFGEINYKVPHQDIRHTLTKTSIPVGFWRSVGSSQNAFFVESFIDEMAYLAGKDPYQFRNNLLNGKSGHQKALQLAARKANWNSPLPSGRARGIALAESFGSIVVQVAEVSLKGRELKVHKVICVYDCGPILNPATIEAQMDSGTIYGLTSALYGEIEIQGGKVVQQNFDTYKVLRLADTPKIESYRSDSGRKIGGIGEVAVPPIAPAVANALFALTEKRVRSLPIQKWLDKNI